MSVCVCVEGGGVSVCVCVEGGGGNGEHEIKYSCFIKYYDANIVSKQMFLFLDSNILC